MTAADTERLSHLLEDAVHDGAVGDVLHALWETCERAGKRGAFEREVRHLTGGDVTIRSPYGEGQLPFFPVTG